MPVTTIKQGVPTWVELSTTDETGALAFYSALFGWADAPVPMGEGMGDYHMQMLAGENIAGISAQQPQEREQGVPPHWVIYLAVDDVDRVTATVAGAGGQVVMEPFDVMGQGRMSVIADPTGGIVSLWQATQLPGSWMIREPNTVTWCELVTDNPAQATGFYTSVLGVTAQVMPMGDDAPYTIIGPENEQGAGIMQKTAAMGPMPTVWSVYFEVEDTDAIAAKVRQLGGSVFVEPMDIMPGRMAVFADPQGAVFGVIKSAPMAM